jgi:pimeloyl-ACP methyl ester carboxylesterase
MSEYSIATDKKVPLADEAELQKTHGLSDGQLAWRRSKIAEFGRGELGISRFRVEYPISAQEAFQVSTECQFIDTDLVVCAMKRKLNVDKNLPLIIGCDVARFGSDRTVILRRRARKVYDIETYHKLDTVKIVARLDRIIKAEKPTKVFIDAIGIGAGLYDQLVARHPKIVEAVVVSNAAHEKDRYLNRRSELWDALREWLKDPAGVSLPDNEELESDLTNIGYKYTVNSKLQMESKDDMKKRGLSSPDLADALILTLAYEPAESFDVSSVCQVVETNAAWY